jgi:type I restriction enzyme M protein
LLRPKDNCAKKIKDLKAEILGVEWTPRHYVQDDEYIPHGFLLPEVSGGSQ